MALEHPTLCQLEYLTSNGWIVGHKSVALLHPKRYVERLTERNKFGRCTELDEKTLKPTGAVYVSPNLPNLQDLVPSATKIPQLRPPTCEFCGESHREPFDGRCLL
jgi:hypothetical protein